MVINYFCYNNDLCKILFADIFSFIYEIFVFFSILFEYARLVTFLFPFTLLKAPYVLAWDFFKNSFHTNENIRMCTAEVIVYVEGNW